MCPVPRHALQHVRILFRNHIKQPRTALREHLRVFAQPDKNGRYAGVDHGAEGAAHHDAHEEGVENDGSGMVSIAALRCFPDDAEYGSGSSDDEDEQAEQGQDRIKGTHAE